MGPNQAVGNKQGCGCFDQGEGHAGGDQRPEPPDSRGESEVQGQTKDSEQGATGQGTDPGWQQSQGMGFSWESVLLSHLSKSCIYLFAGMPLF